MRRYGTNSDDRISGTLDDDELFGRGGNDIIWGRGGDDRIYGGEGRDTLFGGNGNDEIRGRNGDDQIRGGNGDDSLYGGNGRDNIAGGGGHDLIFGGNGNDTIGGNGGEDELHGGAGIDKVFGSSGNDLIFGEEGDDRLLSGDRGRDTIYGGEGADVMRGGEDNDVLYAEGRGDGLFRYTDHGGSGDFGFAVEERTNSEGLQSLVVVGDGAEFNLSITENSVGFGRKDFGPNFAQAGVIRAEEIVENFRSLDLDTLNSADILVGDGLYSFQSVDQLGADVFHIEDSNAIAAILDYDPAMDRIEVDGSLDVRHAIEHDGASIVALERDGGELLFVASSFHSADDIIGSLAQTNDVAA